MVKLVNLNLFIATLIFLVLELFSWSDGVHIGPFIRDLIKPAANNKKQGVFLADFPNYSVVLNFPDKNDVPGIPSSTVEEGEFYVKSPNNYAMMVIVQYLNFRTKVLGPSVDRLSKICRDYIKLSDNRGKETDEICGYVYFRDNKLNPEKLLGQRTFYSANGEVNVKLFIDKSEGADLTISLWDSVQLTFTAATECRAPAAGENESGSLVRSCYPNQTINDNIPTANCISANLFCDDHFHCGFDGLQDIGTDEADCFKNNLTKFPPTNLALDDGGNSVLMILLTFLGLILIIVFIGAYVSSEYNLSCKSCLPRSLLQRGVSNTRISKAAEVDEVSSSDNSPNPNMNTNGTGTSSNYSSFTIAEPR